MRHLAISRQASDTVNKGKWEENFKFNFDCNSTSANTPPGDKANRVYNIINSLTQSLAHSEFHCHQKLLDVKGANVICQSIDATIFSPISFRFIPILFVFHFHFRLNARKVQ